MVSTKWSQTHTSCSIKAWIKWIASYGLHFPYSAILWKAKKLCIIQILARTFDTTCSEVFHLLFPPLLSKEDSNIRACSSSSVQIEQRDVCRQSWKIFVLEFALKFIFGKSIQATVAFSHSWIWGNFHLSVSGRTWFFFCMEFLLHYIFVCTGLAALYMYPEAENGAKSSHPSGKHSVLPELSALLLPWVPGRLAAGI